MQQQEGCFEILSVLSLGSERLTLSLSLCLGVGRFLIFQQVEACQTCQSCCQLFSTSACRHGLIRTQTCTYTFVYTHANLFRAHAQNNSKYPPTHATENTRDYPAVNLTCLHTRPYIIYTSNISQAVYFAQTCLRFQLHQTKMPILRCNKH